MMARLKRFEDYRYIGDRVTMTVYDTDDPTQFGMLEKRVADDLLYQKNLLQSFAPDDLAEARNRCFKPVS
jgi:hypothetical protein